ncbi:hypothetical protein ACS0TY_004153 [Phlomoides rotata]
MYSCWCRSLHRNTKFVLKLGASILLLGLASVLFHNRNSDFSPVSDTQFLENPRISASPVNYQENEDQVPKKDNGGKCDIYVGDWVPYQVEPLYNMSCRFITDHQNCIKNGRPDSDYLYWRWKPRGCDLTRFDPLRFLELMRNKSWAFIGDSISRNHIESLLCILSRVGEVVHVYHDKKYQSQKWLIPSHNFTASVIWSPFLAKSYIPDNIDGVSAPEIELHLDILDENWTKEYNSWDYIIFSSGKWFSRSAVYYQNNTISGCHYCPKRNLTELGLDNAYRRVVKNVVDYIASSNHKGTIFYRTVSPDHFEGGEWYDGGKCTRKVPVKEGELEMNWLDKTLWDIEAEELKNASARAYEKGVDLRVFDVNMMSSLRADGHPGPYRFYQPFSKDKNAKVISDCMHWCLPGPVDAWNDVLMEIIVNG